MALTQTVISHILLYFGLFAALASLYRFTRGTSPLAQYPETEKLEGEESILALTRQVLVIKKLEFYGLMLLVFAILLFYYLIGALASPALDKFIYISIMGLMAYGIFALVMLPVRWRAKRKINRLCLDNAKHCKDSKLLLMHHIDNREDISHFWRNQVIKFLQNRFF